MADNVIPADRESCKTCRFWRFTGTSQSYVAQGGHSVPRSDYGQCRRYAPRAWVRGQENNWPTVNERDWCGEYQMTSEEFARLVGAA